MLRYKYAGIRERKIQVSRDDKHMSRVMYMNRHRDIGVK